MRRSYISVAIVLGALFLVTAIGLFQFEKRSEQTSVQQGKKLRVAATIYPLYDLVRQVANDHADVVLIVPPGALEHDFQLTPSDLSHLFGVRTIFAIGHGLDSWVLNIANAVPQSSITIVDRGITLRERDPHYWLHFGNARRIVDTIADSLSASDPVNAALYQSNAERLKTDLLEEEKSRQKQLEPYRGSSILVFHDAWFYFVDNLGLTIAGAFEPFVAEEPTPRHLVTLKNIVAEKKITTLFIEPQLSSAAMNGFAEENNLGIATLDPLGGMPGRLTYTELMRYNAEQVLSALRVSKE